MNSMFPILNVNGCFACKNNYVPPEVWYPQRSEKDPSELVTDDSKPPCGCWESSLGPLEKQ